MKERFLQNWPTRLQNVEYRHTSLSREVYLHYLLQPPSVETSISMSLSSAMPATNSTLSPLYLFPSGERSYFYIEMVLPTSLRGSLLHIHVSVDF